MGFKTRQHIESDGSFPPVNSVVVLGVSNSAAAVTVRAVADLRTTELVY